MQYSVGRLERLAMERRQTALQQTQYYKKEGVPNTMVPNSASNAFGTVPLSSTSRLPSSVGDPYVKMNSNEDNIHRYGDNNNRHGNGIVREQLSRPLIQQQQHHYEQHRQQTQLIDSLNEKIIHLTKLLEEANNNINILSGKVNASNLAQLASERQTTQLKAKLERSNQEIESLKTEQCNTQIAIKEMNATKEAMEAAFESTTKSFHEEYIAWSVVSALHGAFQRQKTFIFDELSDDVMETEPLKVDTNAVQNLVKLKTSIVVDKKAFSDKKVAVALKRERESLSEILYDDNYISDDKINASDQLTLVRVLPPSSATKSTSSNKKAHRTPKTPSKTGAEKAIPVTGDSVIFYPSIGKDSLDKAKSDNVHGSSYSAAVPVKYVGNINHNHDTKVYQNTQFLKGKEMYNSVIMTPEKRNYPTVVRGMGASDHSGASVHLPSSGMTSLATTPLANRVPNGIIVNVPRTRSPSPTNPVYGPRVDRRFILSGFSDDMSERIGAAIRTLGEVTANYVPRRHSVLLHCGVDGHLPLSCTHVVIPGTPQSFKAFCALVSSRYIVNPDYIFNSLKAGFWLDEESSVHLRCHPPPLMHRRFLLDMAIDTPKEILDRMRFTIEFGQGTLVTTSAKGGVIRITSGEDLLNFALRRDEEE